MQQQVRRLAVSTFYRFAGRGALQAGPSMESPALPINQFLRPSYSWEGEDRIAEKLVIERLGKVDPGFYVDLGAHHPYSMSNTAIFYMKGWRGINIDATPGSMDAFRSERPQDINLELAVADEDGERTFFSFADAGLNGFLTSDVVKHHTSRGQPPTAQTTMRCRTINSILAEYAPGRTIDLMNIDIEGSDESVLRTLDERWLPQLMIIEILTNGPMSEVAGHPITKLMESRGYDHYSRLSFSSIFLKR